MSEQLAQIGSDDESLIEYSQGSAEVDDADLVDATVEGDRKAFALLFERHSRRLLGVANAVTHSREDAEDAVQEGFQKAYTHLRQFARKSSFSTWLTRIVVNESLMILRNRQRSRARHTQGTDESSHLEIAQEIPDPSPTPEAMYSCQEREHLLDVAMRQLTPETRKALQLRELDGFTTKEAAQIVGVTLAAMKSRVLRGRKQLRDLLEERLEPSLLLDERIVQLGKECW